MAVPTGVRLKPNQLLITETSSTDVVPTSTNLAIGEVVDAYNKQMAFSTGQTVVFDTAGAQSFKQNNVEYYIVNQNNVQSQVNIALP